MARCDVQDVVTPGKRLLANMRLRDGSGDVAEGDAWDVHARTGLTRFPTVRDGSELGICVGDLCWGPMLGTRVGDPCLGIDGTMQVLKEGRLRVCRRERATAQPITSGSKAQALPSGQGVNTCKSAGINAD